jgi:signal transduction histidine kinase
MNQEVLYQLFEEATTAIIIYQQQRGIRYMNPRARSLLSTNQGSLLSYSLHDLFQLHSNRELLDRLKNKPKSFTYQNATISVRGMPSITTDISVYALNRSEEGQYTFQLNLYPKNTTKTINHKPDTNYALVTSKLLEVMRQQTEMPLSALDNLLHRLLEESPREDQLPIINSMLESGEQLRRIVQNILLYARLTSGKYSPKIEIFSPLKIVEELKVNFRPELQKQGSQLLVSADISQSDCYRGDLVAFREMLSQLLDNAVRFTQHGQVQLSISCASGDTNQIRLHVAVTDNGPGIPTNLRDKVISPFVSDKPSWEQENQHSGLGLSIVRLLAEQSSGRLNLQHEPTGTRAALSLPYLAVKDSESRLSPGENKPGDALEGLRVLYAEDLLPNHFLMEGLCAIWGVTLDTAYNGREAVDKFFNNPYDVILMDLNMPVMSGLDASQQIRSTTDPRKRSVPIIAVSGSASPQVRQHIQENGINDILSKPIQPNELYQKLSNYANV